MGNGFSQATKKFSISALIHRVIFVNHLLFPAFADDNGPLWQQRGPRAGMEAIRAIHAEGLRAREP
jgi:hypothetical protein